MDEQEPKLSALPESLLLLVLPQLLVEEPELNHSFQAPGIFAYTTMSTLIKVTLDVLSGLLWAFQGPRDKPHFIVIMEVSRR